MESRPFFQGKVGCVGQLTHIDLLEVESADITVDDSVSGFFFDPDIAKGFVIAVFAVGTLEPVKVPPGCAPGAECLAGAFAMDIEKP